MSEQKSYVKSFKEGEIIFCEFEPGNTFYMIKKGKVRIAKVTEKYEKTLDILDEGSIFGEMAIIEQAPRSATVIAETDVTVTEFTKENFKEILSTHPELLVNLIRILCFRTFEAKRRLAVLQMKDSEGRLIDALLMLAGAGSMKRKLRKLFFTWKSRESWNSSPELF
jgi:CRP-like cAMP-binding protein